MLAEIGLSATFFAFAAAFYAIVALLVGERTHSERIVLSGRNAALSTFFMLLIATGALEIALMTEQYQMEYVAMVSDSAMPTLYRLTAIWGSQSGSLLFWSFLMSGFSVAAIFFNWDTLRRLMPYAAVYMMATLVFFVGLTLFVANPFERIWFVGDWVETALFIPDGAITPPDWWLQTEIVRGLDPLLRHFGMAFHPPALYLGFVGFMIPFALAMGALASGDLSNNWLRPARTWGLIAWIFLSLGLLLGGRWAYDVLGWGGYWGWDPVENAALLPWLTGTAFLHSIIIQEKRGMFKTWNLFLVIGTFSAVIFGTFATRSGLVNSVHSFAESGIGYPMFLFWFSMTLISSALILWRGSRGELKSERRLNSLLSRETLFIANNLVFLILFLVVFWGSFGAPIISEMVLDTPITLSKDYFMQVTPPILAFLFVLMGIAPVSSWGVTSMRRMGWSLLVPVICTGGLFGVILATGTTEPMALLAYGLVSFAGFVAIYETYRGAAARRRRFSENWLQATAKLAHRNPRRYGGYMVHLSITIIGIGVIGSTLFQTKTTRVPPVGGTMSVAGYEVRYDRPLLGQIADDGRVMNIVELTVFRNGREVAHLRPRRDIFTDKQVSIAGSYSTLRNDLYILLDGWDEVDPTRPVLTVYVNPLINLIWIGGLLLIFGTAIALWPKSAPPAREHTRIGAASPQEG